MELPIKILSIEEDGFHVFIDAKVAGKAVNLLIDTGASRTVFDKNRFTQFVPEDKYELNHKLSTGLGTSTMESHKVLIEKFVLGTLEIKNYEAVLLDMTHVNESYDSLDISPIDGVLGGDLLVRFNGIINYPQRSLSLNFSS